MASRQSENFPSIPDAGADDLARLQSIFGRRVVLEQIPSPPMPKYPIAPRQLPIDQLLFPILRRAPFMHVQSPEGSLGLPTGSQRRREYGFRPQEVPMPYRPKLDPKRDLAGATPETLARALFRRVEALRPRPGGEPVVGDEPAVRERAAHEPGDDLPHLVEGV